MRLTSDAIKREWVDRLPYIKFPSSWDVKIIPPFAGAMVRFIAARGGRLVSVYLDVDGSLGFECDADGEFTPYWEACPYGDDVFRCPMADTDALVAAIERQLSS